jgi:hypothetical protein
VRTSATVQTPADEDPDRQRGSEHLWVEGERSGHLGERRRQQDEPHADPGGRSMKSNSVSVTLSAGDLDRMAPSQDEATKAALAG